MLIDLKNIDIQKCKEGDVIYNTTINLLYPFVKVSIKYVIAKGHYKDNKCVNCVEVFFRTSSETSQVIIYKTFSEINNEKYIEFRTNYIKKLLKVKYNTLDIYSKQVIQYAENSREIIPENQYFLKIIEMIDQYGKSFLNNFIKTITNNKDININEKNQILEMYAKYYKDHKNNSISKRFMNFMVWNSFYITPSLHL